LKLRDVRRRFDSAAASFDSAEFVHTVTRDGLFARLAPLVIEADRVLDLGSATGSAAKQLRKRFAGARVIALDISYAMLREARRKRGRFFLARTSFVQANASSLPFQDQRFDVVFCNLLLPFIDDPKRVFEEVARVLRRGGVFAFATLGPDSLLEISRAWNRVDSYVHVNRFLDMHDLGDLLIGSGLRDPVLDVDRLSVQYENARKLFADITSVGARNALRQRNPSLVGKHRFEEMLKALTAKTSDGKIRLDLELVYGHCWGGGAKSRPTHFTVDASHIPRRRG
jgi:malonyl-CoA O-methyltransferase